MVYANLPKERIEVDVCWRDGEPFNCFWPCEKGSNPPIWLVDYMDLVYSTNKDAKNDNPTEAAKTLKADKQPDKEAKVTAWVTVNK